MDFLKLTPAMTTVPNLVRAAHEFRPHARAGDGGLHRPRLRRDRALSARGGGRAARTKFRSRWRKAIREKVIALGFYAANFPAELGGGGLDAAHLHAARTRARAHRLGACRPFRPALQHPAGLRRRAARALPAAGDPRRKNRRARHVGARRRLRRPLDEDALRAATAPTGC